MTLRLGGCQCGQVRYELMGEPIQLYVCHCRECRKQSASAFGISVIVPPDAFRLTQGAVKFWSRPTDSGGRLNCAFCADCGSRLWHATPDPDQPISVKGGSLDEPVDLSGAAHIWTSRMLPGIVLPEGAVRFEGEPPA
jgi:hypothetical protein